MIPGQPFDPATQTSRRPTPETFAHLRKWVTPVDLNVMMTNITELTNIDQQIEQISRFYISSIIQRTISQLTAQYNDGFRTLKCTEDGYLIVQTDRETKTQAYAAFDINVIGDNEIVAGEAGKTINITGLVFTVGGENDITLKTTTGAISGPMPFGGVDEPRGMVDNKGFLALQLPTDDAFIIELSAAEHVMGYVCVYIE